MEDIYKYLTLILVIIYCSRFDVFAQCISNDPNSPACNDIISTDPANPSNIERAEMENHFDWTNSSFDVFHPTNYTDGNGGPLNVTNPYYTTDNYLKHINYKSFNFQDRTPEVLDFYIKDGWELIHKGNGFELNEIDLLPSVDNRNGPYFILYNKNTGTLRILAAFDGIGANQIILTILKFSEPTGQASNRNYSALLSRYGKTINPLDVKTDITEITQGAQGAINGGFFFSDFKVTYDPCVCNYVSNFEILFRTYNAGNINLDGRLVATSVPLDGSGVSPLLNDEDFLTAVHKIGFNVQGGMLTYNNIDKLIALYETPDTPLFQDLAFAALDAVLKGVAKPLDGIIDNVAGKLLTSTFGGTGVLGFTLQDTLKVGFGAIGALTKQISSGLSSKDKIPNISFIEAEMSLSGRVEHEINLGPGDIEIAVPGSLGTNDAVITPERYYPAYNEALGLFAVLNTPIVNSRIYRGDPLHPFPICDDPLDYIRSFSFSSNDFKFTFNPSAEINIKKSKIYGALVVKIPTGFPYFSNANFVRNITDETGSVVYKEYITDFYPIESLHKAKPYFSQETCYGEPFIDPFSQVKISLRLQVFYSFKENRYGKENTYWEILTYPINTIDNGLSGGYGLPNLNIYELPSNITINDTHYSSSTTIKAINNISIEGNITASQGVEVTFMAGNSIIIRNPSSLKPNIKLISNLDNIYGDDRIPPASNSYVKSFCATSGGYKANDVSPNLRQAFINDSTRIEKKEEKLIIYPNPASESFKVATNQEGKIKVEVYNLMGNLLFIDEIIEGVLLNIPTDSFGAGVYIVKTTNATSTLTKRVIIK